MAYVSKESKATEESKPVVLYDKDGKSALYHSIDAKEILKMPDCQYSRQKPELKVEAKKEELPEEKIQDVKPKSKKDD